MKQFLTSVCFLLVSLSLGNCFEQFENERSLQLQLLSGSPAVRSRRSAERSASVADEKHSISRTAYDELENGYGDNSEHQQQQQRDELLRLSQRSPLPRLGIRSFPIRLSERAPLPRLGLQTARSKRLPRFGLRSIPDSEMIAIDGLSDGMVDMNDENNLLKPYMVEFDYPPVDDSTSRDKRLPRFGLQKRALPLPRLGLRR